MCVCVCVNDSCKVHRLVPYNFTKMWSIVLVDE